MKRVGAHVSASGGVSKAIANALSIDANAFALFVKNQKQWFTKPFSEEEEKKFKDDLKNSSINLKHILPHGSYLINIASPKEEGREKSIKSLKFELDLCSRLGINKLNIHPGSSLGLISEEEALDNVARSIDGIESNTMVVIENTAGQGNNVGYKLEHLKRIIDNTKKRVGICIDTCHSFAAGYDLTTYDSTSKFFDDFNNIVGIEYLEGLHLNDSKTALSSRKDRHDSLGKGLIGLDCFKYIMNSNYFDDIPLILETVDPSIWKEEIKLLYSFIR